PPHILDLPAPARNQLLPTRGIRDGRKNSSHRPRLLRSTLRNGVAKPGRKSETCSAILAAGVCYLGFVGATRTRTAGILCTREEDAFFSERLSRRLVSCVEHLGRSSCAETQ